MFEIAPLVTTNRQVKTIRPQGPKSMCKPQLSWCPLLLDFLIFLGTLDMADVFLLECPLLLGGGFEYLFNVHPYLGKLSELTHIF